MELSLSDVIQWVWLAPLAFLWQEIKAVKQLADTLAITRPTRAEVEKYVDLSGQTTQAILQRVEEKLDRLEQKLDDQAKR